MMNVTVDSCGSFDLWTDMTDETIEMAIIIMVVIVVMVVTVEMVVTDVTFETAMTVL